MRRRQSTFAFASRSSSDDAATRFFETKHMRMNLSVYEVYAHRCAEFVRASQGSDVLPNLAVLVPLRNSQEAGDARPTHIPMLTVEVVSSEPRDASKSEGDTTSAAHLNAKRRSYYEAQFACDRNRLPVPQPPHKPLQQSESKDIVRVRVSNAQFSHSMRTIDELLGCIASVKAAVMDDNVWTASFIISPNSSFDAFTFNGQNVRIIIPPHSRDDSFQVHIQATEVRADNSLVMLRPAEATKPQSQADRLRQLAAPDDASNSVAYQRVVTVLREVSVALCELQPAGTGRAAQWEYFSDKPIPHAKAVTDIPLGRAERLASPLQQQVAVKLNFGK